MAANTTYKVAALTGAAKDDLFTVLQTGLTEDNLLANHLNVLGNDPGAAKLYSLAQETQAFSSTTTFPVVTEATSFYGASIAINADGTILYDAGALGPALQSLAAGEMFMDSFVYTVRMANGALSTATATVQIAGMNDPPTLAGTTPVSIFDTADDDTPGLVTGHLVGTDVDHGAVLTYGLAAGSPPVDGHWTAHNDYGTLILDAATGAYSFIADPDKIDALRAGETATSSFDMVVTDEHGASSNSVKLDFTLVGANDTASIGGKGEGSVQEDGNLTTGGVLTVSDRDHDESAFATLPDGSLHGIYGDFTFDTGTGAWTYTLRNGDGNVQALSGGQNVNDTLAVTSLDGSAAQTIRVSVAGMDEAPAPPTGTDYKINNGLTIVNGQNVITGFGSHDRLVYSDNFHLTGITHIDAVGNDGQQDSSAADFTFARGQSDKVDTVEVVLIGYMDLTTDQVVAAT